MVVMFWCDNTLVCELRWSPTVDSPSALVVVRFDRDRLWRLLTIYGYRARSFWHRDQLMV